MKLGPFTLGVNNRRPAFKMQGGREDGGDFLRFAVNADISAEGTVKRRQGYVRRLTRTDAHSFWSDGTSAFMVDGPNLLSVTGLPDNAASTTVRSDLTPGRPMSFVTAPDGIYYSNGQVIGRLTPSPAPVNPPALATPPSAAAIFGAMPPGTYGLCFTHIDTMGRESGSTAPIYVTLTSVGGIRVSGLPAALPAGVLATVVYMTAPNDQTLMRAFRLEAGATADFTVQPTLGARCATLLMRAMPAGDIVRYHSGRLLVAAGPALFFSEPFMHGLHNPMRNYIRFPADITVVESTTDGVWICADQTYWLPGGDVAAADLIPKLPYGGVRGSSGTMPNSNDVYWMSPRGMVVGSTDGTATNRQEARVAVAPAAFGAGLFRESDGRKQIAQTLFAPEPNRMAAASYMDAEVVRKKVTL